MVKSIQSTKLKEIGVDTAMEVLTEKSKSCTLAEVHLATTKALCGQGTLYEACLNIEDIIRKKVIPAVDKLDKKVHSTYADCEEDLSARLCLWSR